MRSTLVSYGPRGLLPSTSRACGLPIKIGARLSRSRLQLKFTVSCNMHRSFSQHDGMSDQLVDDALLTRDELKERSRRYQRTLSSFTWERWASHRSTWRYLRHMHGLLNSSIVRGLTLPLLYVGFLATSICCYEQLLEDGVLPTWLPSLQMPTAPFDLTSFALALLLVFRTNTSYGRFDEACQLWSRVANRTRDTLRQVVCGGLRGGSPSAPSPTPLLPAAPAMSRWLLAYVRSLKALLTEDSNLKEELQDVLEPAELEALCVSWHPPSFALSVLGDLAWRCGAGGGGMRDSGCVRLEENLTALFDAMGACERILRTPIPLSYTRHTSRFLVIWLTCLPLGLWPGCHWATIPLSLIIAFLLLGVEEIGVQIEEPFGLLPLEDLCREIEGDLHAMLREASTANSTAAAAVAAAATGLRRGSNPPFQPPSPLSKIGFVSNNSVAAREGEVLALMRMKLLGEGGGVAAMGSSGPSLPRGPGGDQPRREGTGEGKGEREGGWRSVRSVHDTAVRGGGRKGVQGRPQGDDGRGGARAQARGGHLGPDAIFRSLDEGDV